MSDLEYVLSRYEVAKIARVDSLGAAGGMSGADFWKIESTAGTFILRRWPAEHPTASQLRFIHAVLRHVYERGFKIVPVPRRDRSGETFVSHAGRLWEISPWMAGQADFERDPSPTKLSAALAALARFHVAAAGFSLQDWLPFAGGQSAVAKRLARLRELPAGGIATLERAINNSQWPEFAPLAREFVAQLPRALPKVLAMTEPLAGCVLPRQPCIRDIWHDHVLFTGDEVTGLVDFGALDGDTPATDVARLLGSLAGDDEAGWRIGLAAYTVIRPLSADELRAVKALDASGTLLAGCNWIRWIYIDGRQFENSAQVMERFNRIVARHSAL